MRALLYSSLRRSRLGLLPLRWPLPSNPHANLARRRAHSRPTAVAIAERPTESPAEHEPPDVYDPTGERLETTLPEPVPVPALLPPPPSAQEYPAAWTASVESCLPQRLRTAHPRWPLSQKPETVDIQGLPALVLLARTSSDVDVLASFALEEGRWDAMLWLADAMLHVAKDHYLPTKDRAILHSIQWPKRVFLDDWTYSTAALNEHKIERSQESRPSTLSLDRYTFSPSSTSRVVPNRTVHKQLGSLWETIGELILTATSQGEAGSRETMRYTLRLLGQLHYHGFIPSKVYNDPPTHDAPGVRQPSLLSEISPNIMSALLDASMDDGTNGQETSDPYKPDIGPGLWMEFVLWCCVRGGWLIEASKILDKMRKKTGSETWHLVCWQQLETSPESTLADLVQRRLSADNAEAQSPAQDGDLAKDFERTVSSEVVVALVDALTLDIRSRPGQTYPLQHTSDRLSQLHEILERDKMTLNGLTWDEVIARFADRSATDMSRSPEILESLLTSVCETYWSKTSVAQKSLADVAYNDYTSIASAAILGLFHDALRASNELGDAFQALRIFKSLQDFTDQNQKQALQGFYQKLSAPVHPENESSLAEHRETTPASLVSTYPAFLPSLPPTLVAALLDLWSAAGLFDICRWMVDSEKVDDLGTSQDMYSDPVVAPAILRFALTANDSALVAKINEAAPRLLKAKTLISIGVVQLEVRNLNTAASIFRLFQNQIKHKWELTQLASVIQALLPLLVGKHGETNASEASSIFEKLYSGEYGRDFGIEWLLAVLASVNEQTKALCSPCLHDFIHLDVDLPVGSFDSLLGGCVKVFGSQTGMEMWQMWCDSNWRELYLGQDDGDAGVALVEAAEPVRDAFAVDEKQTTALDRPSNLLVVSGSVSPELTTLRIIVRQALTEVGSESDLGAQESSRKVLAWAEGIYADRFGLSGERVTREMSGYSSLVETPEGGDVPYSKSTRSIWRGVSGMKRGQRARMSESLRSMEGEMRRVAQGEVGEQTSFEAISRLERKFVHQLALDLGLFAESVGREPKRGVVVSMAEKAAEIPALTVEEWLRANS